MTAIEGSLSDDAAEVAAVRDRLRARFNRHRPTTSLHAAIRIQVALGALETAASLLDGLIDQDLR